MERNYTRTWLVGLAVLFCGVAVARAQEPPPSPMTGEGTSPDQHLQPFGPVDAGTVSDGQLFKQPDLTQIGTYPELNYGPFFQYERLYWSEHQPSTSVIGDNAAAAAAGDTNDMNTGFMKARFVWGNRSDLGYVQEDESGWLTSILKTNTQFNTFESATPTFIYFANGGTLGTGSIGGIFDPNLLPTGGIAGPAFSNVTVTNTTRMAGVELMRTYRYPVTHDGGIWTLMYGARFFQLHERFDIEAETAAISATDLLGDTFTQSAAPNTYDVAINNNLVGPQIGLRWEHDDQRWDVSADFRAMIGANFENATSWGFSGSGNETVFAAGGTVINGTQGQPQRTFQGALDSVEFAPLGELRLDAAYKVTQNVSIKVGYTALLMAGIGRPSNRIEYNSPALGISSGAASEHFFTNGLGVGVEVNR